MKYLLSTILVSCLRHASSVQVMVVEGRHGEVFRIEDVATHGHTRTGGLSHVYSQDVSHVRSGHRRHIGRSYLHIAASYLPEMDGSNDWFFGSLSKTCDGGESYDIDSKGPFARFVMCFLVFVCVAALLARGSEHGTPESKTTKSSFPPAATGGFPMPQDEEATQNASELLDSADNQRATEKRERLYHLDFARICAIGCVIFEHSGGEGYTHRNVAWGLWWALPFLYITSGMGNVMSRSPMLVYAGRLLAILVVGVSANLVADMYTGRDWQSDFPNTVFQMWFVVMLIMMTLLAEPLRKALRHAKESPDTTMPPAVYYFTFLWGAIFCVSLAIFLIGMDKVMPDFMESAQKQQQHNWLTYNFLPLASMAPLIIAEFSGMLFLPLLACIVTHPSRRGIVGWVLLLFTYAPIVFLPWDQDGFIRCICLYVFAMVVLMWPLAGSQKIANMVQSYWPLMIIVLCCFTMPEMVGRCDMHPPGYWWERLRFNMGECILVVSFVSGGFKASDPYNITGWLGWWSLYAYCFHVCWARLFGHPWGALLTLSSTVIFWALLGEKSKGSKKAENAPKLTKGV